ncbi:outer membrane protein assembly factor BamA [Candidatus Dependentiae bacterium]|nr:outer membrane protein assembly factor BamA [Candidatus Dependentiae bacterium]
MNKPGYLKCFLVFFSASLLFFNTISCQGDKESNPVVKTIVIEGNKFIKKDAILRRLSYKEGEEFDPKKSADAVHRLYALGYFRQVQLEKEVVGDNLINLYVVVEERKLLDGVSFHGNKALRTKKISDKLEIDKVETIDEEQLRRIVLAIQEMYRDENFHFVKVDYKVVVNKENPDKASVEFHIDEGKKAKIKRIHFRGCKKLPERKLRTAIFTREDWVLGFLDDSGKYSEESVEMDKKRIEYIYRDHGFLMARVVKADAVFSENKREVDILFDIREGDIFTVRYLSVPGDNVFNEDELLPHVTLEQGEAFSQSKLVDSISSLKAQWGNVGYIHADVYPQVLPNEETKEVDITFHVEKGKKIFVNRINITGNKITKDRVIRRELTVEEGDLLTSKKLAISRNSVEFLGFFEKGSVNWKTHKLHDDKVDLELKVRESKTGKFNLGASYGSDKGSSERSLRGNVQLEKSNFWGRGFDIGVNAQSSIHRFQKASIYFFDPHIFDTDISTAFSLYIKQEEYDQWKNVTPMPIEKIWGGSTRVGFLLPWLSRRTRATLELGAEHITNNNPRALPSMGEAFQARVEQTFQEGDHIWLGLDVGKDTRNHRVYPTHGYKVFWNFRTAPPGINRQFSFVKTELDWSWYTPLIGEDNLVLALHAWGGVVDAVVRNKIIPYKELFHMGGQDTVRGFVFGGVGPAWYHGDPLGARKAFQFNAELIFPLVPDYQMKGHVFYDAGAGWDTPKGCGVSSNMIKRDKFNLRHSVGFGINLSSPFPAKIDWGYKLDRDKAAGESPHEFHIAMNTAW